MLFKKSHFSCIFICTYYFRCFTLFDELDQLSTRFKKLQTDIIKRYTSTCIEYKDNTFIDVVNSMTPTKVIELPLTEQENEDTSLNNEEKNGEKSSKALTEVKYNN